jgi:GNAT superfamily N-acetyltransferase
LGDNITIMADWRLRQALMGDVEAVAELRAVVLRPDLERLGRYDEHRVRQRFRDGFTPAHTKDTYWLEHFYLAPELQGKGIGSAVLGRLLERCDREAAVVRLNVLRGSAARRLYERHGFTVETEDEVDVFMVRDPGLASRSPAGAE